MFIPKHVEHGSSVVVELDELLISLRKTTAQIESVTFTDLLFAEDGQAPVLLLECDSEERSGIEGNLPAASRRKRLA